MRHENGEAAEDDEKLKGCEHRVVGGMGYGASSVNIDTEGYKHGD